MLDPAPLSALLERQDGMVARRQLRAFGVSRHLVRNQLQAGRWQVVGPRVVATLTGQLNAGQTGRAAALHAGPSAAVAGLAAAQWHGLIGWSPEVIDVLVPHGLRVPSRTGLRVHETRHEIVRDRQGRSPVAHGLWDAAAWMRTDAAACGVLAAGVQQRLVRADTLLEADDRPRRRRRLLALTCADIAGGAEALSEMRLGRLARLAGLPAPIRPAVRRDAAGRRRYLDADFGTFAVEVDGMPHLDAHRHAADLLRQNDLALIDQRLLRHSALTVRAQPAIVVTRLRRAADHWRVR